MTTGVSAGHSGEALFVADFCPRLGEYLAAGSTPTGTTQGRTDPFPGLADQPRGGRHDAGRPVRD